MHYNDILNYWFGFSRNTIDYKKWFSSDLMINKYIQDRFEELVELARMKKLDDWKNKQDSCVALIILIDQFPRNIYKNSYRAFAFDDYGLQLCNHMINNNMIFKLNSEIMIMFALMPLQHSESINDKKKLLNILNKLNSNTKSEIYQQMITYTIQHQRVLEKYGKYPMRNFALGRKSTPEELNYIRNNQRSF